MRYFTSAARAGAKFGFSIRAEHDGGMVVAEVAPGSIAERAGLKADDVLVSMNGEKADGMDADRLRGLVGAKTLRLVVERDGKTIEIEMNK